MGTISSLLSSLSTASTQRQSMFSRIDTDSSGTVTKDEFIAARPQNVSEDQAASLYDKIDTAGTNALTQDQLDAGMKANAPTRGGSGSQSSASGCQDSSKLSDEITSMLMQLLQQVGSSQQSTTMASDTSSTVSSVNNSQTSMFDAMDTDGDGVVNESEFVAARPDNVSEDQAKQLFSSIDTTGSGSITEQQFAQSMQNNPPPPPPQGGNETVSGSSSDNTNVAFDDQTKALLQQLLQAIQTYNSNIQSTSATSGNSSTGTVV